MKPSFYLLPVLFLLLLSCKMGSGDSPEATEPAITGQQGPDSTREKSGYPPDLQAVLDAHGGLDAWNAQQTLRYDLPKEKLRETHTIDLKKRWDRIESPAYSLGYDGTGTWILDPEGNYEGNPEFYHNLMFYFYAMPFVLADPGIKYATAEPLDFEGTTYPGLKISYGADVGTSPEDEYYIHYHPDTHRMSWLGYTVTYYSGTESDDIHWIRYDDWETFNGLLLPRSISWYEYQGRQIGDERKTVRFEDIELSPEPMDEGYYEKPAKAVYFEPESGQE